jgi:hypothetical protein
LLDDLGAPKLGDGQMETRRSLPRDLAVFGFERPGLVQEPASVRPRRCARCCVRCAWSRSREGGVLSRQVDPFKREKVGHFYPGRPIDVMSRVDKPVA